MYVLTLTDTEQRLVLQPGETILAALERYRYRMRRSCRNGVCEICQVQLLQGDVQQRYPAERFSGPGVRVLACTAVALSDLHILIEGLEMPGVLAVKKVVCEITQTEKLNHDVYRIRLQLPATGSHAVEYYAGQYLNILLPSGKQASFSIASAPDMGRDIELHIRHMAESEMSSAIVEHLLNNPSVEVELPQGDCYLQATGMKDDTQLVLVAASTGFAQVKSMVEHLLANQHHNPIHIYWGARSQEDFYLDDLPEQWAREHTHVTTTRVVEEAAADWSGSVGLLPQVVLSDIDDFSNTLVIGAGSPGMVYALLDVCEEAGMSEAQMKSDVFAYAPRPKK
ncbi:MAG: FAD-binding oxidoreductase [Marinobacterium sp.]|nr:FAD-binding oxidoreductase [Marinobacterium sp.]